VDHAQALAYLDAHINLEKTGAIAGRVRGLGLDTMRALTGVLGDPQHDYPVIHITGTNGKGSTARMIAELLAAHGLRVGLYTSPHLQRVNERLWWSGDPLLRVDTDGEVFEAAVTVGKRGLPADRDEVVADAELIGLDEEEVAARLSEEAARDTVERVDARPGGPISDDELAALLTEMAELEPLSGVTPSYFELIAAAAFTWFAQLPVDVAVIEVGLLGLYDATNVADGDVAVITNIGQDHTDFQGDWRAAIAREKSGIVKPESFLVLGETDEELRPIFEEASNGRLWVRETDFTAEVNRVAVGGRLVDVRTPGGLLEDLFLPVHGEHQGVNGAVAIAAVEAFFARPLDPEVAQIGLGRVQLPGRFEIVGRSPLLIVDGAHNPDGAQSVDDTLHEDFDVNGRLIYVVGMLGGRDPEQMLEALGARTADLLIACTPPSPRALPADQLAKVAHELGIPAESVSDVAEAIERARAVADAEDVIVVTGSLYVAGAARDALGLEPA
jgi:dihydrofolate synthase/folylpolyglutamate synthase